VKGCIIIASNAAAIAEVVEKSVRDVSKQVEIEKVFNEADLNRVIHRTSGSPFEPGLIFLESDFCEIATAYLMARKLADNSRLRFVIFSFGNLPAQDMGRFYNLGAVGFLNYRSGKKECLYGISKLLGGDEYITPEAEKTLKDYRIGQVKQPNFTIREIQVLRYTARGRSLGEIAELLSITVGSVQNIKTRMYRKAGIKNNVQVMLFALYMGYVTVDELIAEQYKPKEGGRA
jgi:DNA-binding NarL/FixJ family response regulator